MIIYFKKYCQQFFSILRIFLYDFSSHFCGGVIHDCLTLLVKNPCPEDVDF